MKGQEIWDENGFKMQRRETCDDLIKEILWWLHFAFCRVVTTLGLEKKGRGKDIMVATDINSI